jgi:hypothetical protein
MNVLDPVTIALWGPRGAGKTAFLAQLFLRPGNLNGWEVFPTRESQEFLAHIVERTNANFFPAPTSMEAGKSGKVRYQFKNRETGQTADLFVEDRAGGESTNLTEEGKQRMNRANGLVLLFESIGNTRELEQQISWALSQLHVEDKREFDTDPRPVAVCLSKADQLIDSPEDFSRVQQAPSAFVRDKISPDVIHWVSKFCSNFELFPISTLGVRNCYGAIERMTFYDENYENRISSGTEPLNLFAPFAWIFSRLEGAVKK